MADVLLLSLPASPFAMSVKIALAEKGVAYEAREESFPNKSDLLLKYNPVKKQVPVLIHHGKPVCESLVILEYIEDAWKGQGTEILPTDAYQRAEARFWATYGNLKFWETALLIMKRLGDEQIKARDETVELYHTMEKEWKKLPYGTPFFFGESLSLPDLVLAPLASWKPALETLGGFSFPDAQACPRMAEWLNAIEEHPSVKASITHPDQIVQNAIKFQNRLKEMSGK